MNKNKKIVFLLSLIISLASLLGTIGISAASTADILITATTNETLKQGETGYCYVYIESLEKLSTLSVACHYDSSKISVSNLYVYNKAPCILFDKFVGESSVQFSYIFGDGGAKVKTQLFYFQYKVLSDADVGSTFFDVVVNEAYDSSLNAISVVGSRCLLTVAEGENKETHSYTRKVISDKYKKSDASCTDKAVYFYCCATCDAKGSETFEYGEPLGHTGGTATCKEAAICSRCSQPYGKKLDHVFTDEDASEIYLKSAATCTSKAIYYKNCATCDLMGPYTFEYGTRLAHVYDKALAKAEYLASAATCLKKAEYYWSCACGAAGKVLFEYGEKADHIYKTIPNFNETSHWYECSVCSNKTSVEAHVPGSPATETTSQICTVCDYVIAEPIAHTHDYGTDWHIDGEIHWQECSCGSKADRSVHIYDTGTVVKDATYDEEGEIVYTCTVCAHKKSEVIEKLILIETTDAATEAVTDDLITADTVDVATDPLESDVSVSTSDDFEVNDGSNRQDSTVIIVILALLSVCVVVSIVLIKTKK